MVILLWIWTLGTIILYTTSKFTRLQRGRLELAGEYKAVFELSEAMQDQLVSLEKEEADGVRKISESSLRQRIKKDLRGGAIAYETSLLPKAEEGQNDWTFKAWARREIWWLLALVLALTIDGIVIDRMVGTGVKSNLWFFLALPLAITFAMYVGLTHSSRMMVLLWAGSVVCVLPAIVLGAVMQALLATYN